MDVTLHTSATLPASPAAPRTRHLPSSPRAWRRCWQLGPSGPVLLPYSTSRLAKPASATSAPSPSLLPPAEVERRSRAASSAAAVNPDDKGSSAAMEQLDIERGVCVPFRKYTPEGVRRRVLGDPPTAAALFSLAARGVEIVWNLGLYWSALAYDCLVGRDEEVVPFRARQLRNLLCDLGPSFIKAGQVSLPILPPPFHIHTPGFPLQSPLSIPRTPPPPAMANGIHCNIAQILGLLSSFLFSLWMDRIFTL